MRTIQPSDLPFNVQDAICAFSLHMAGVPFAEEEVDDGQGGKVNIPIPCTNLYDNDTLKKLGYAGMELEDGARQALKDGKKGHLEYHFRCVPELGPLLEVYRDQQKEITEGPEVTAAVRCKEVIEAVAAGGMLPNEALLRLACINLKLRVQFMNIWKGREDLAFVRIPNAGRTETAPTGDGKITHSPGWKIISLNASEKLKKKFKL